AFLRLSNSFITTISAWASLRKRGANIWFPPMATMLPLASTKSAPTPKFPWERARSASTQLNQQYADSASDTVVEKAWAVEMKASMAACCGRIFRSICRPDVRTWFTELRFVFTIVPSEEGILEGLDRLR